MNFRDMPDDMLKAEFERWDKKVKEAPSWGASLMLAAKWRDTCERLLFARGLIDKVNPSIRHG